MAKHDCDVCGGRGVIQVALHRMSVVLNPNGETAPDVECLSRRYACPECSAKAAVDRVFALDAHVMIDMRYGPEAMPRVRYDIARRLADHLLKAGFIEFDERPGREDGLGFLQKAVIGTVWAVHPAEARRSIEDRIRERQQMMAATAADRAIKQIDNWGRLLPNPHEIAKDTAVRLIREAVREVNASWSKEDELRARGEMA